jgi:hypothetical protein
MQIDNVSKVFLHVQNNYDNSVFFSNVIFPYHHSFSKLKKVFTLMIIKEKAIEIGKFHF